MRKKQSTYILKSQIIPYRKRLIPSTGNAGNRRAE
jgi:hypothetical protein